VHGKLVGRRTELSQFTSSLDACLRDGSGFAFHLRGEPGIGKTRLSEEFHAIAAARGFQCHRGVVLDFGSGAERDAMRAIVLGLLGVERGGAGEEHAAVARATAEGLVSPGHLGLLHDVLHHPLPPTLRQIFDAMDHATREREQHAMLARLLEFCSARTPRLLLVEDLHWAPPRTLSGTAALAAAAERCCELLVMTSRSEGDPLNAAWRGAAGIGTLVTIDLGPLRWAETSALAAQFGDANDPFVIRCVERSGGNPLFLQQLVCSGGDAESNLPTSVQSVVQARLDTLDAAEREAVRVASVLGQRFVLAALNHLLGAARWDPHRTLDVLRTEGDDGVFAHALVHEAAYASLPRSERRTLHDKAALWFKGRDATLHAEHLDRADDPRAALAYLDAARQEAARHRNEQALKLAARGLELARPDSPRFGLACCRADMLQSLGATAEARTAYDQAIALATNDNERCRAWLGMASVLRILDDLAGAEAALTKAEESANARRLAEQLARIHFLRGNLLFPRGDLEGCQREHERSLALARETGSAELEATALGGLGDAAFLRGHMLTARERFTACVVLAQQHGFKRVEAANRPMVGIARWYVGETRSALDDAHAAIAVAQQIGHRRGEIVARHNAYQLYHSLRQFDAALVHIEQALVLSRQINARRFEAEALAFRGEVRLAIGQRDSARTDLLEALAIARATGMSYMGPIFLGMLAVAAADRAEYEAAIAEGEDLLRSNTVAHNHLLFRRDAIDACLAAGDWVAAERHAEAMHARTQSQPLPWSDFFVARGRALARHGAQGSDAATHVELTRLRLEGQRFGLLAAVVAIDAALGRP